ncbi:MAG: serine hydrolase domain-containing protein [Kofleriaceae bacterium]
MKTLLLVVFAACNAPSKLDALGANEPAAPAAIATPLVWDAGAVDAWVASEIATRGAIGASLVVVKDGAVVLAKGYGKTRAGDGVAVTADTPFALGSVSKQFLCTVVYALVDAGRVAMTDRVATWYPTATRASDITLADLGGHTSGYRDYYPLDYIDTRLETPVTPDEVIATYAGMPLDFEPGSRWSYSNTGFQILARVAEKVTGQPYAKLLADTIFTSLGMTTATLEPRATDAAVGHASFVLDGAKPSPREANGWLFGAGDIWASANDVAKWNLAIADGKLLAPASHQALRTPRTLANGRGTGYSCGFVVGVSSQEQTLSHGGWVGGFHTSNIIVPRTRSAVVLLTNDQYTDVTDLADTIASLLTREVAYPMLAVDAGDAVRELVVQLQSGVLDRTKLGDDANAYFDDARVAAAATRLRDLGPPTVKLSRLGERGGMEVSRFTVKFTAKSVDGWMFRSADGKIRQLLFSQ